MKLEVRNDRLYKDGDPVKFVRSPNRGGHMTPRGIVDHDTASFAASGSIAWFRKRISKVSAHVVVDLDGEITQMVDFDRVAWHAGKSWWNGKSGLNRDFIGIEIVSPGKLTKVGSTARNYIGKSYPGDAEDLEFVQTKAHGKGWWAPYTKKQLAAVKAIHAALAKYYDTIEDVVGHYEISPGRKTDPSPLFPMDEARTWIKSRRAKPAQTFTPEKIKEVQLLLARLQYGPGVPDGKLGPRTVSALFAFQKQNGLKLTGDLNDETIAKLDVVIERFEAIEQIDPDDDEIPIKPMPNGDRAEVTAQEIAHTSRTASAAVSEKREGIGLVGVGAAAAVASQAKEGSEAAASIVSTWGISSVILAIGAVLLLLGIRQYLRGGAILGFRLNDHRTGRHLGGPTS